MLRSILSRGIVALAVSCLILPGAFSASTIERVSLDDLGNEADDHSEDASISGDGRFVAFASTATNLVPGDAGGFKDIFVYDRAAGTIQRASVDDAGTGGDNGSDKPGISRDGLFVAFASTASNLVAGDMNGVSDIFVRDLLAGTTERVSVNDAGIEGNGGSWVPGISADGRYVVFVTGASNFAAGQGDVYVYDRQSGTIEEVCKNDVGVGGNGASFTPFISADGRFVIFGSYSTNLVTGDTNGVPDIFVFDRQSATIERVSVSDAGVEGNANCWNSPTISDEGRFAAFTSDASNLVADDLAMTLDAFVFDRQTKTIEMVSKDDLPVRNNAYHNASISADGRYVAFDAFDFSYASGDTNAKIDIILCDRQTGGYEVASLDELGFPAGGKHPALAGDGGCVAFKASAALVTGDSNLKTDIYASCGVMVVPTPTPTSTISETATESASHTPSGTATFTPTVTESGTRTPTCSETLTVTVTPTATLTFSESGTLTQTMTATPSATRSGTATQSASVTRTGTGTATPTVTAEETASATATASRSASATSTCTASLTASRSASATSTCTASLTLSCSATVTATPTVSLTVSETVTPSVTRTYSRTFTDTLSDTLTATLSPTRTQSSTISHTLSLSTTATASATPTYSDVDTATVTPTATRTVTPAVSPSLTPSASVTATTTASLPPTPLLTHTITLTATPLPLAIADVAAYPNPWNGAGEVYITFLLSAPAERLVISIYTVANRKVGERTLERVGGGSYARLGVDEGWCGRMGNGIYLFTVEVYEGSLLVDRKVGKIVVLR